MNIDIKNPAAELSISREYEAPRSLVLQMIKDPEMLTHWWGPNGFSTTTYEMNFKPGGIWRFTMHGPDGTDYPNFIKYIQTNDDEIIYQHSGDDGATYDFMTVITLTELGEKRTRMDFRMLFESEAICIQKTQGAAKDGLQQLVVRLEELLQKETSGSSA